MTTRTAAGFTLAELAVVAAVLALLLGGLVVPLSAQQDMKYRQDTEKALAAIQEALIGFALVHGRLPCPATATAASGTEATSGAGAELACAGVAADGHAGGVLPWATLGLPETDVWGNRYSYGVSALYARGIDPAQTDFGGSACPLNPPDHHSYDATLADGPRQSAFAICTPGVLSVLAAVGGAPLANGLPAVVVSHGKNGAGAYTPHGTRIAPAAAGSAEEENADGDATVVGSLAGDDLVAWVPRHLLVGRMLAAGKLP